MPEHTPARRDHLGRPTPRLTSVLVPGSSPSAANAKVSADHSEPLDLRQLCRIGETSSDSIEAEQILTPSAEANGKRLYEEEAEEDHATKRRAERAQAVAAGWKCKYSFKADVVSQDLHPWLTS